MSHARSGQLVRRKGVPRKIPYSRAFHSDAPTSGGTSKSIANLENRLRYLEELCMRARKQGMEAYATGAQSVAMGTLNELNTIYKSVHGDNYKEMPLETFWDKENIRKGVASFKIGKLGGKSAHLRDNHHESRYSEQPAGEGILLPEDAERAAAIRKTVGEKKISYQDMRSQMEDGAWHARVEKSIAGQLNEIKRWVQHQEAGRSVSLYSNLMELTKQLPLARQKELDGQIKGVIQQLAAESRANGREDDAALLEKLLVKHKVEKSAPIKTNASTAVQTVSRIKTRGKPLLSGERKSLLITPAMRSEMINLLKLPAEKFLSVLTKRLDTLHEKTPPVLIRRVARKSSATKKRVSRTLPSPRIAPNQNANWVAEIQSRMSGLPEWQQNDVRELVQIAQTAMRYEIAAARKGDRKTAQRCVRVGDRAMATMREILGYPSK